jgi:2-dehydropantoate 2-reductase
MEADVIAGVETVCKNAPNGYTSIYADIRDGRRSEVDTISGSVVEAARRLGVSVPCHEMIVSLIHALERRPRA